MMPIFNLIKIIKENGGVASSKLLHLAPWLVKFTLFQPLSWYEKLKWDKQIAATPLPENPIFILGHYRSGTTYLQRLLMQDERFGYQSVFESGLPELMLTFKKPLLPILSAVTAAAGAENKFHHLPFTWDFPGEEDVAVTSFGFKDALHWGNLYPAKMKEYFGQYVLYETGE